ncbi:MAG: DUF481 domain-containing protein [Ignavibacteriaceae bacterium]|nr:DUF481 domain-containing protein [Ignavibacteriaceae bacterium]
MTLHFQIIRISFVLLLLSGRGIYGQINESDTAGFRLQAGLSGAWQQGNVELLSLRGRIELATSGREALVFKSQNTTLYQEFSARKADNDIYSRNFLYWEPGETVYPFAMIFLQTNIRRKIDFRWFAGAGATWQFLQNDYAVLKLSAAMVREETEFLSSQFTQRYYDGRNDIRLWRGTVYTSGWIRFPESALRINYSAYWQPGLDEVPNNRFQADISLSLPLWRGVNMQAVYTFSREEITPVRVQQQDHLLTFGFSYQITQ